MQKQPLSRYNLLRDVIAITLIITSLLIYFFPIAFDPTPTSHYTWVHFHFMSILQNTTPRDFFVGYSYLYHDGENIYPHYFNRYSPLTNILLYYLLPDLSLQARIFAVKAFFTGIYIGNCICVYLIARLSGLTSVAAASLFFFVAAQHYFLYPKDMAHFDQMALLGLFVQILLLMSGRKLAFFIFTIFALHLGRNFMLILTSLCFYTCGSIKERSFKYIGLLAIHLASFLFSFGYNVLIEIKITGGSLLDTSILNTFQRRTGIVLDERISRADWPSYAKTIVERIGDGVILNTPKVSNSTLPKLVGIPVVIFIVSLILLQAQRFYRDCTFFAVVLPPIIFFSLAKGLIFFHDYTLMWLIPMFTYVLSQGIVLGNEWVAPGLPSWKILLLLAAGFYFGLALYLDRSWKEERHAKGVIERIQSDAHLVKEGAKVCMKGINHHSLNALLPGAIYAQQDCDFILSRTGISARK